MDTHIQGPRANGYGAVPSVTMKRVALGDAALVAKEILRTVGASVKNPLWIRFSLYCPTAFDGTSPAVSLAEQNLDGTGAGVILALADLSSGRAATTRATTVDKKYLLTYTLATGSPTAGEIYVVIEVSGGGYLPA